MYSKVQLTGNNSDNLINLTGIQKEGYKEPIYVIRLKKQIFNLYIIPLQNFRWEIVNQNMFKYDILYERLLKYYKMNPSEDLSMYIQLLDVIYQINGEYNKFREDDIIRDLKGIAKLSENMPTIKLAPAYELYNLILGRPKQKGKYDDFIIKQIQDLLKIDNITFDKIKDAIV